MTEPRLSRLATTELAPAEVAVIRSLMEVAFGSDEDERFTDADWAHAVGGTHFVLDLDGGIVSHASVVEREIHIGGQPLRTGYVEAVATAPDYQGAGFGSLVMADVTGYIRAGFELGALGTGRHHFHERLDWLVWEGPSSVRTRHSADRTLDADGFIMVLATPASPPLDPIPPISCEWRHGDVW